MKMHCILFFYTTRDEQKIMGCCNTQQEMFLKTLSQVDKVSGTSQKDN